MDRKQIGKRLAVKEQNEQEVNSLVQAYVNKVKGKFAWRGRSGNFYDPTLMASKHVFYVMLMIWNHAAPENMRIWANHCYEFPDFYTPTYMLEAFQTMYAEAYTREDLGHGMKLVLEQIGISHLNYQKYLYNMEGENGNQISYNEKEIN